MLKSLNEFEQQHPEILKEIRQLARLADVDGFEEEYLRQCAISKTYQAAYYKTEEKYKWLFGETCYSNYNSFRVAYSSRQARKRLKRK